MLTGDLADFSLRSLLEFLSAERKSGLLTVRCAGVDGGVFLRDGGVCLALVDVTRVPLGPRLVALDLLDRRALRAAGSAGDGTTFGLACGLLRAATDADRANAVAVDQTCDALGWLDRQEHASFLFDHTVAVDDWPYAPLPAGDVLVAINGDADLWTGLRGVIDDLSAVPSPRLDVSSPAGVHLSPAQWRVVALSGGRSLHEIIEVSGLGVLETCCEVAGLIDAGALELVAPGRRTAIDVLTADARAVDALAFTGAFARATAIAPHALAPVDAAGSADAALLDGVDVTAGLPAPHATADPAAPDPARPDGAHDVATAADAASAAVLGWPQSPRDLRHAVHKPARGAGDEPAQRPEGGTRAPRARQGASAANADLLRRLTDGTWDR